MKSVKMWADTAEMCSEGWLISLVINKYCIEAGVRDQEEAELFFYYKKQKIHL